MSNKKLYLLDAHALCYRAFFAVKGLTNSKGQPTNAVYGFVNALRKMLKDFKPEYFAVCFDKDGKTFRQEKYQEYKIQRPAMPDDLRSQMALIHAVVEGYGLPVMEISGYEADDLMGTMAEVLKGQKVEIVIVSDDKDLFQLVDSHVGVYSPRKDELLDADGVKKALGIEPKYVADFLGLAGDSSDNIPGVAGIGKVTAQKLISQFGSLENIYNSLEKIASTSVKDKLTVQKDAAFLSRELAQLRIDAPLSQDLEDWKIGEIKTRALYDLFTELEFHRFAAELKMDDVSAPQVSMEKISYCEIEPLISKQKRAAFLINPGSDELFLTDGQHYAVLKGRQELSNARKVFEDPEILKIVYDSKELYKVLWDSGVDFSGRVFDVMLAGYLLNPSRNGHELSALAWEYLKIMRPETADFSHDVLTVFSLYDQLSDGLEKKEQVSLLDDIEMPLARVLAAMEQSGVRLDLGLLGELSKECAQKIDILQRDIYTIAGEEFNINSPKQLGYILFEKLKLPAVKKTKTGFSTNEEVLHKLALHHELPEKILDYRQLAKLKSTYIDALPELVQAAGGDVIHASFNQTVTETGRLSSSNPNLQNIPIRTELGKKIRRAFIPLIDGHQLFSADYSQIELRILAHLSKDENLIRAFQEGEDIHAFTAGLMFDVGFKDVTIDMRNAAKRVNFGIIYGMSSFGLAKDLNIGFAQAQDFIDRYFFRYPKVKEFMDQAVEDCCKKGYAITLMNRRREIPEILSKNAGIRQFAERQAINTPVQGSAADLIKLAMVRVYDRLEKQKLESRMMITVHDEIVFDMVPEEKEVLIDLVTEEMEGAMILNVPITVSIKIGKNWLDMEKVKT